MERRRIKRVPVFDGDAAGRHCQPRRPVARPRRAPSTSSRPRRSRATTKSCEHILAELAKAAWVPRDGLAITVKNGIVELDGVILDEKEREALRVVAENAPGVRAVEDHLVWIEPVSGTVIEPPQKRADGQHLTTEEETDAHFRIWRLLAPLALLLGRQAAGARRSQPSGSILAARLKERAGGEPQLRQRPALGSRRVTQSTANTAPATAPRNDHGPRRLDQAASVSCLLRNCRRGRGS